MKYAIRFIILFLVIVISTGNVRAITDDDIIINIQPDNTAGTVTKSVSGMTVTITATPATGYSIDADHIIAEKMINAMAPRRSSPGVAPSLPVTDNGGNSFSFTIPDGYSGAYVTVNFYNTTPNGITSLNQITNLSGNYVLTADVDASGFESLGEFTGTLDGGLHKIYNLNKPLFSSTNGAIIRNITFEEVSISESGNTGAVTGEAKGASRIYNIGILSGSVGGTGYTGGLVGLLDGTSRVINCYSYATITGGTDVGGIVGYNNGTTTAASINTMVMNCMFYGDITGGTTVSPVYGGKNIDNLQGGLNTYNYYSYEKLKSRAITNDKYNCALAVEEKYLNRFEFYRLLLNSNKKLAAFYATGSTSNGNQMAKWVLETADRSIIGRNPYPYPILKAQGYYPSIINIDAANAPDSVSVGRNKGGKLGKTLSVTISGVGDNAPSGASITTHSLTLQRTDKDFDRFNFNYDKVQLPYYNEVGSGNYTGNRVVTGWKITAITTVDGDPYTSANYDYSKTYASNQTYFDYPNYNFADRKSSNKDLYSVSGRVFSQGAYFDVPYGVTSITIEPYWGKAYYIADQYYDVVYKNDYSGKQGVTQTGTQVTLKKTKFNGQYVETSITRSLDSIANNLGGLGATVYDNALVLVGNLHLDVVPLNGDRPFTMMSVDEDNDHEPDYSLIYHHKSRSNITPIRFDFLTVPGTAQAQKPNGASLICNFTIFKTRGWFEVTNTAFMYSSQIEYENGALGEGVTKSNAPLILLGGVFDQFVSTQSSAVDGKTIYIHVGSNVWINSFGPGTHSDGSRSTPHVPVSVTGGDYEGFYLTGTYNADATVKNDNAECYISGGRFGEVAGASLEQIGDNNNNNQTKGNVRWQIYNADIENFFGGGINDAKSVKGNITTDIFNSHVDLFCGGPKFGNMATGKKVTTNAVGCTFGTYFGAGYGGTSLSRKKYYDTTTTKWDEWADKYIEDRGKYFDGSTTSAPGDSKYGQKGVGVATDLDYEFFVWSSGATGGRFFVKFASFSLAQCNDVSSTLKQCTVETNFYGGGNLGKVVGTAISVLENSTVKGDVYGGGYSASLPTVEVRDAGFTQNPNYNSQSGMFEPPTLSGTTTFTWQNAAVAGVTLSDKNTGSHLTNHILYTNTPLTNLGEVANTRLTITGTTTVGGNVYGGGEESGVGGNTQVFVNNGTIGTGTAGTGNVFGAGKGLDTDYDAALVKGNSTITMTGGTVKGSIFGGGELSSVGTFTRADAAYHTSHPTVEVGTIRDCTDGTGTTTVTISGGTVGNSGEYTYTSGSRLSHSHGGNVFAGGKGVLKKSDNSYLSNWIHFARVKNTVLNVSGESTRIMSSIYGGGEIGSVGYLNESGALVEGCGTAVTVSDGIVIGTEIKDGEDTEYTFGSVFGGGYGSDLETTTTGQTDPNAPKLYAGRIYGNTSVTMSGGAVKASIYGGGELASVSGNATVTVSGGSVGIPKDLTRNKQFGGATMGNVYGGGSGSKNIVRAGQIYGNTTVSISEADPTNTPTLIYHNVYGGGAYGSVGTFEYHYTKEAVGYEGIDKVDGIVNCAANTGTATITITGGTLGADGKENGMIFGSSRGDIGAPGSRDDLVAWVNHTSVTIGTSGSETGPTIKGSVYGSGENGHVLHNTAVTIHSGKIGVDDPNESNGGATYPYRGNVYGAGCGTDKYYSDTTGVANPYDGNGDSYNPMAGIVEGTTTVTIDGGYVVHHVYGAGAMGSVGNDTVPASGKTTINISGGRIGYDGNKNGNVFGAARGEYGISTDLSKNLANVRETEVNIDKHPSDATKDPVIWGSVFGGGESGVVKESVTVNMKGGLIKKDIYGGGALADTQTSNWDATKNANKGGWATGKTSASAKTTVNLTGGTVTEEVFGGGLGESGTELNPAGKPAYVYGDVLVELNKDVADDAKGCIVGEVFGCNNLNGTPMGDVKVHIYKTQHKDATRISNAPASGTEGQEGYIAAIEDAKVKGRYDVLAVYGGGNQSAYEPANPNTNKTEVIIDGCELTSIRQVYGGGNAACTPSTNVTVNGTFEIMELFGGGNGLDAIQINGVTMPNPGANVGYKNYSVYYKDDEGLWQVKDSVAFDTKEERMAASDIVYGTGKASVNIYGGTIHRVFGGSNTKGNVRQTAVTLLDESSGCPFRVDEAYGGGKSAEMDAEAQLLMACIPGLQAVYGGAEAADVHGNVTLNITNGTFDRVFGGNNLSGTIGGAITINVQEIGCRPIFIGELYGGGNQAAYSVYGYKEVTVGNETVWKPRESATDSGTGPANPYADPQVNVMSFTSIGQIFGGGYGNGATMVGNPTVNINEVYGKYYNDDDESENPSSVVGEDAETPNHYPIPSHAAGKMGAIYNVFGGGNAAKVIGNTTVNIGTLSDVYLMKQVSVGDDVSSYYTRNNDGSYSAATGTAADGTTYYEKVTVLGADIRGNVYGGGNNAEVTGNTNVNIGQRISE